MIVRISIAMATYNGAKYLDQQLDSFLIQERLPDELVVCDDGSKDDTISILETFSKKAPFAVRVFRNPSNLGFIKNFEKALSLCTGDLIFLSDQDDVWYPNKIIKMSTYMDNKSSVMVLQADMHIGDENAVPTKFTKLGNTLSLGLRSDKHISGCSTVVRKWWLNLALPIPEMSGGHDNWIHQLASTLQVRAELREALQCYRRHTTNASNSVSSKSSAFLHFDSLKTYGLRDTTFGWKNELKTISAIRTRLLDKFLEIKAANLSSHLNPALKNLDLHAHALESRINLVKLDRWARPPKAIRLWAQGDYRHFAGWRSLAKDLVRPQCVS